MSFLKNKIFQNVAFVSASVFVLTSMIVPRLVHEANVTRLNGLFQNDFQNSAKQFGLPIEATNKDNNVPVITDYQTNQVDENGQKFDVITFMPQVKDYDGQIKQSRYSHIDIKFKPGSLDQSFSSNRIAYRSATGFEVKPNGPAILVYNLRYDNAFKVTENQVLPFFKAAERGQTSAMAAPNRTGLTP